MIHPKTLLISRHFYSLESYVWRSIYNLKIDTISTFDIPLDRSFLKLWNGIRHVMPSTDRRLELKEKKSMAQTVWQPVVYAKGIISEKPRSWLWSLWKPRFKLTCRRCSSVFGHGNQWLNRSVSTSSGRLWNVKRLSPKSRFRNEMGTSYRKRETF